MSSDFLLHSSWLNYCVKFTVLGSGTLIPVPDRGNSGYFLQSGNTGILIDGGSGALRKMADFDLDYLDIDGICYSHLHPDHTFDLIPLLFALKHDPRAEKRSVLKITAPIGFKHYFKSLMDIYEEWVMPEDLDVEIEEISRGSSSIDNISFQCGHTEHTEQSITYRFSDGDGGDLFYSGDTDYCEELLSSASEVDLMILECSFPDDDKRPGHLTPMECGKIAAKTECGRLVLTHFYPHIIGTDIISSVEKHFDGPVDLAYDGMELQI